VVLDQAGSPSADACRLLQKGGLYAEMWTRQQSEAEEQAEAGGMIAP
jgi:hypothetical protein